MADRTEGEPKRGAFDVLMRTAKTRPELMHLLPTFPNDGREWDDGAIPVDVSPLRGFNGFDRSQRRIAGYIRELKKEFHKGCLEMKVGDMPYVGGLRDKLEREKGPVIAAHKRERTVALALIRCGLTKELVRHVVQYEKIPMPPANLVPTEGAYICEIRVYYKHDSIDGERESLYNTFGYVNGLVLLYSDGTMVKTGDIRGCHCMANIIMRLGEHIVGFDYYEEYHWKLGYNVPSSLVVYTQIETDMYWQTVTKPQDFPSRNGPYSNVGPMEIFPVFVHEENHVIKSLSWCSKTHRISNFESHVLPRRPSWSELMHGEAEQSRIAGFSPNRFHDPDIDQTGPLSAPFTEYYQGEGYLSKNLVPAKVYGEVHKLCCWDKPLIFKDQFNNWLCDFQSRANHALLCSNEAHNIIILTKIVSKTKDKVKKRNLQKKLRWQYKALDKRVEFIIQKMDDNTDLQPWYTRYKQCYISMSKNNPEINRQLRIILQDFPPPMNNLLVCAWCPGNRVFDPRHVPEWQRCTHPGCCMMTVPCCRDHVSQCRNCFQPVCHYHLKHTEAHRLECEKTLVHRCGWQGYNSRTGKPCKLDNKCCGKIVRNSDSVKQHADGLSNTCDECGVVCCRGCAVECLGWRKKCRCTPRCEGVIFGKFSENIVVGRCPDGKMDCTEKNVWCKSCFDSVRRSKDKVMATFCKKCDNDEHENFCEDSEEEECSGSDDFNSGLYESD